MIFNCTQVKKKYLKDTPGHVINLSHHHEYEIGTKNLDILLKVGIDIHIVWIDKTLPKHRVCRVLHRAQRRPQRTISD